DAVATSRIHRESQGVWVPAFAGTTLYLLSLPR
ncbi:MAG: hypothetical protein QOH32_4351, partial [Bradyrhizobium sp.]|nr:hypothetical protein [Bradyrhizobium sp.]